MRRLVMGDIHGADKALQQCLERSDFDPVADTLIQMGDVTDKRPGVYACVDILLQIQLNGNLIAIRGNHDAWFREFLVTGIHPVNWDFGGKQTVESYRKKIRPPVHFLRDGNNGFKTSLTPQDIPFEHQVFFSRQLTHYIDQQNNCFIHGGFNRHLPFESQDKNIFYCDRKLWSDAMDFETVRTNKTDAFYMHTPFQEAFIGHTPTTNWFTDLPMHCANVWNLDTGAGSGGKLTIMDIETKEFWQSDTLDR